MGSLRTSILKETSTHLPPRTPQCGAAPATPSTAKSHFIGAASDSLSWSSLLQPPRDLPGAQRDRGAGALGWTRGRCDAKTPALADYRGAQALFYIQ